MQVWKLHFFGVGVSEKLTHLENQIWWKPFISIFFFWKPFILFKVSLYFCGRCSRYCWENSFMRSRDFARIALAGKICVAYIVSVQTSSLQNHYFLILISGKFLNLFQNELTIIQISCIQRGFFGARTVQCSFAGLQIIWYHLQYVKDISHWIQPNWNTK